MNEPELVIIAGPNGSGKSSLTRDGRLTQNGIAFPERYINADDIAKGFEQTMSGVPQVERERAAFREARTLRQTYREDGKSFAFETVFSHPSTLMDMRKCRNAGFAVTVLFVCTANAEINVARVVGRVQEGGHHVELDTIRSRYARTMRLMPRIVEEATTALVFDSTEERQTRLCYRRGRYTLSDNLPHYLAAALTTPIEGRKQERTAITAQFGAVTPPNEETGGYAGEIVWRGEHYAVQETPGSLVQHDGLLFDALPSVTDTAPFGTNVRAVTIRYKDNAGTVEK